jgi:hypothetical protein
MGGFHDDKHPGRVWPISGHLWQHVRRSRDGGKLNSTVCDATSRRLVNAERSLCRSD